MSYDSNRDKYSHSVIDVSVRIHDAVVGSGESIATEVARLLVRWLHWRVNHVWYPSSKGPSFYDEAVRLLALSAISMAYDPARGILDPSERED